MCGGTSRAGRQARHAAGMETHTRWFEQPLGSSQGSSGTASRRAEEPSAKRGSRRGRTGRADGTGHYAGRPCVPLTHRGTDVNERKGYKPAFRGSELLSRDKPPRRASTRRSR